MSYQQEDYNQTVTEFLQNSFDQFAAKPAFTCLGQTLTYGEIDKLSRDFAAYIQNYTNLKPGDRIAIQLPNVLQYPVVAYGAIRAGLVVVNTNPLYTSREISHQLKDSGAKALVVFANVANCAAEVVDDSPVEQVIVTEIADLHPPVKRGLINFVVRYIKKMVPAFSFKKQVSFRDTLAKGAQHEMTEVAVKPEDLMVLQYTGGTTGVAKGAMLTHRNLVANMLQVKDILGGRMNEGEELYVAPLPLYHIYAFTVNCLCMMASGNHNLLIPNPRDIPGFVKAMRGQRMTGFAGLNTLFNALCRDEGFKQLDFSSLKVTISGGMALTMDAADRWQEVTGCQVSEGYGLTETSPVVSTNPMNAVQMGTVGIPVIDTEIRILDEEGNEVSRGEPGELTVRGPQVMAGYWQRPEETAKVLDDEGWLKTGDMAVHQEDNYLKIVDRKKDMIIVSGFNVYPNEIEDVVCQHPDIVEAAAVGIPDDKSGEVVKLFVVVSDKALTEAAIRDFCRDKLTAYKIPRTVEFRDDLPKTNVGKILRRELRDQVVSA